jgi:hypothetical protein
MVFLVLCFRLWVGSVSVFPDGYLQLRMVPWLTASCSHAEMLLGVVTAFGYCMGGHLGQCLVSCADDRAELLSHPA